MGADLGDILYEAHTRELLDKVVLTPRGPKPTFPVYRWDTAEMKMVEADPLEPLLDKIEDNLRSIQRDLELVRAHLRRDRP